MLKITIHTDNVHLAAKILQEICGSIAEDEADYPQELYDLDGNRIGEIDWDEDAA